MRKFGLIGYPLSHSFSPAYFAEKFAKEKREDCLYEAFPIQSLEELKPLLQKNINLEGLNITIPYKKNIIAFLHDSTDAVKQIGACNCIKITNGKIKGYNTDVAGFEQSLVPLLTKEHNKALVLGTGGAAAAVEFVLQKLAIPFVFVSRNKQADKNVATYKEITGELLKSHKLIINTTPVGMYPATDDCPEINYDELTNKHYLYDLVYNPGETLFLKKGAEKGTVTKNGSDMLIIQAEESWKIWNEEA